MGGVGGGGEGLGERCWLQLAQGRIQVFIEEGLQVLGAPHWLLKWALFYLKDAVMGELAHLRARRAPLLGGETPYLLRKAQS